VKENLPNFPRKLISPRHQVPSMDEEIVEITIHEYGPDVVTGMPEDQKIRWKDAITISRIHILEEFEPIGTQKLKTEDIIEELNKLPKCIRKHIGTVVLAPFNHIDDEDDNLILASADWAKAQITIYAIPLDRSGLKDKLAQNLTLAHEAGHIIDRNITQNTGLSSYYLSYTPLWSKAMCEDGKIKRTRSDIPSYLISPYAEKRQSIGEDFADSVMYFSHPDYRAFLKENYPNRYKILEDFLEPRIEQKSQNK
jgi:hypothetical protein